VLQRKFYRLSDLLQLFFETPDIIIADFIQIRLAVNLRDLLHEIQGSRLRPTIGPHRAEVLIVLCFYLFYPEPSLLHGRRHAEEVPSSDHAVLGLEIWHQECRVQVTGHPLDRLGDWGYFDATQILRLRWFDKHAVRWAHGQVLALVLMDAYLTNWDRLVLLHLQHCGALFPALDKNIIVFKYI